MNMLRVFVRKILAALNKVCYGISRVWLLIPVLFFWATRGVWLNMETSPRLTDSYLGVTFLAELLFVIAIVYLFLRDKILQGCLAIFVGVLMLFSSGVTGLALQSAPTSFAEEHPIPKGLVYDKPKKEGEDLEMDVNPSDSATFLQVRNGSQGGIYEYSFFYPELPEGTIWLECYEVTENLLLSGSRIKKVSSQEVNGTKQFSCLIKNKSFTIYEGDWGDCYAARIEVWFKDKQGQKRKLLEKVYGVQGWMR